MTTAPEPLREALQTLADGRDLEVGQAEAAFLEILDGRAPEGQVASLLTALRIKGETAPALLGAVRAVRSRMVGFEVPDDCRPLLDTCGTGGDGTRSFNVSTAVAIVAASCGIRVAKHGNRSASGNSGSSEVLTLLGVDIEANPAALVRCLKEANIAFLYAPRFHPALRGLAAIRRQLPFRTLFNLVGPLANPARPEFQLIGVPALKLVPLFAEALSGLGGTAEGRIAVVHGSDGMDEVTLGGTTQLAWTGDPGGLEKWSPEDFGLQSASMGQLSVSGPEESARVLRSLLVGEKSLARDVVLANTAAALVVVRRAADLREGVALAAQAIDRGDAARLLERWARISQEPE